MKNKIFFLDKPFFPSDRDGIFRPCPFPAERLDVFVPAAAICPGPHPARQKGSADPCVRPALDRLEERLAPAASPFAIGSPAGSALLIRLFDSDTEGQIDQIRPFQPSYTGGVHVTLADLDRDGAPEIIASAASGSPHVVVFDGANP